ncbi:MAG: peptidyl-prolyl cis-trans isomerase [Lachnospira sp.]|nr:peptidyl-prolyl cis-trans isomerase [Lachnospira sp.]
MKHENGGRPGRRLGFLAIPTAIVVLIVYILFFNGNPVYFTFGLLPDTMLRARNQTVTMAAGRLLLSEIHQEYRDIFGEEIWNESAPDGSSMKEYARDQVEQMLGRVALINAVAEDEGIVLSDSEESKASLAAVRYLSLTPEANRASLGLTEENLTQMFRQFAVAHKYYDTVTADISAKTEVSADEARVIDIQYIAADSQEAAERLKAKIDAGQTFISACQGEGDLSPEETELIRGMTESSFEEAAFALTTGENSDVIASGDRYYIIHCLSDNEAGRTEANITRLKSDKVLAQFNSVLSPALQSTYVEVNTLFWNRIDITSLPDPAVTFTDVYDEYFS